MRRQTLQLVRLLLLLTVAVILTACSNDRAELEQWVAQQKARKGAPLPALPVVKTFETFIYEDQDLRDPFASPVDKDDGSAATQGPSPDPNRVREPLESYTLDSLKMVGTIGDGGDIVALVKDPDNVIHRLRDGNYAGQNYGHVVAISEDNIELVELVPDGSGGWIERNANIALAGDNP